MKRRIRTFGSVNILLGWPLRYSHSPGEVIDRRDLDARPRSSRS